MFWATRILLISAAASGVWAGCIQGPCPRICTFIYQPICAQAPNGTTKTFPNRCAFSSFVECDNNPGWQEISEGECPTSPPTLAPRSNCGAPCPRACTLIFQPICGQAPNGTTKTFPNRCAFRSFVECDNNPGWEEICEGECPTTTTPAPSPINCGGPCPQFETLVCVRSPCGKYEETYSNQCFFEMAANCGDGRSPYAGYTFEKYGPCFPEQTTTTTPPPITTPECQTVTPKLPCIVNCPLLTKIYSPVCAQGPDGQTQTFENSCFFDSAVQCDPAYKGWEIIYQGECQSDIATCVSSVNTKACTKEFRPICAIGPNGQTQTFPNRCQFDNAIIYNPKYQGWGQLCEGECSMQNACIDSLVQ